MNNSDNSLYNEHISSMRVRVEHLNGIIKGRWSSLRGISTQIKALKDTDMINANIQFSINQWGRM